MRSDKQNIKLTWSQDSKNQLEITWGSRNSDASDLTWGWKKAVKTTEQTKLCPWSAQGLTPLDPSPFLLFGKPVYQIALFFFFFSGEQCEQLCWLNCVPPAVGFGRCCLSPFPGFYPITIWHAWEAELLQKALKGSAKIAVTLPCQALAQCPEDLQALPGSSFAGCRLRSGNVKTSWDL